MNLFTTVCWPLQRYYVKMWIYFVNVKRLVGLRDGCILSSSTSTNLCSSRLSFGEIGDRPLIFKQCFKCFWRPDSLYQISLFHIFGFLRPSQHNHESVFKLVDFCVVDNLLPPKHLPVALLKTAILPTKTVVCCCRSFCFSCEFWSFTTDNKSLCRLLRSRCFPSIVCFFNPNTTKISISTLMTSIGFFVRTAVKTPW